MYIFRGTHISDNLSWSANTKVGVRNAQASLHDGAWLLVTFHHSSVGKLPYCISLWYTRCTVTDEKSLVVLSPFLEHHTDLSRAINIVKASSCPTRNMFELLPRDRDYGSFKVQPTRFLKALSYLFISLFLCSELYSYQSNAAISSNWHAFHLVACIDRHS